MKRFLLSSVSMSLLLASCVGSTNVTGKINSDTPPRPQLQFPNQIRIFPFNDKNADGLYQPDEEILSGVRHLISGPGGSAQCYTQESTLTDGWSNLCYFSENALPNATYEVRVQPVVSSVPNTAILKLPRMAGEVASSDPYSMVLRFSTDEPARYDVYWPYQFGTALPLEVGQIRGTVKLKSALDNSPFLTPNLAVKFTSGTLVRQVYTDSEGRFALGSLPVGPAQLEVWTADQPLFRQSVMVATGPWTEINLEKEISANWRALDVLACLDNDSDGICNLSEGRIDPTKADAPALDVMVSLLSSKVGHPQMVLKNGASSTGNIYFNFPTAWTLDPLAGLEEITPSVTPPDGIFCKTLGVVSSGNQTFRTQQQMPCVQAQPIEVQAFEDQNGDAVKQDSEPLLDGLRFEITHPYGNLTYTPHQPLSLPPGKGSIKLIEDETSQNLVSTAIIDSQKLNPGTLLPFYVSPSSANILSLPYIRVDRSGKLMGYIFEDTNGNGVQDNNEQGIPGVKLTAIRSNASITALREQYAVTDPTGRYLFEKLEEGLAQVIFEDGSIGRVGAFGSGFNVTAPRDTTRLDDRVMASTQIVKDGTAALNFGLYPKLTKFNVSFYVDANRDGVRNVGERNYDDPLSVNVLSQNSRPNSEGLYTGNDFTQKGTFSKGEFVPMSSESLKAWIPSELAKESLYVSYSNGIWGVVTGTSRPGWAVNTSVVYPLNLTDYSYPNAYHPFFELKPDVWTSNVPVEIGIGLRSVAVSGVVFDDLNKNDTYDSGEPVLPKATVEQGGKTIETDASGSYRYASDSASWQVPSVRYYGYSAGESITRNQVWSNRFIRDVNMLLIKSNKHTNIQETLNLPIQLPKVAVSGRIFEDANNNGRYDAEPVLSGVPVSITDFSGNVLNTTTNSSGLYNFMGVSMGSSTLSVDARGLPGYTSSTPLPAPMDVQWNSTNTLDIGFVPPASVGTIKGMVFDDVNKDSVRNPGEPGISGVKITAKTAAGSNLTPVTTGANGLYTFDNAPVGDVTLNLDRGGIPAGYAPTSPTSLAVTVSSGKETLGNNFGLRATLGSIKGKIFDDIIKNGVWDVTEKGFKGVEVTLNDANGNVFTALTDAQGEYSFSGVSEGSAELSVRLSSPTNIVTLKGYKLTTGNLPMNTVVEAGKVKNASSDIGFAI